MIKQTLDAKMLEIASIQDKHENDLLSMQNVVGVALGNRVKNDVESDESVISVLVSQKVDTNLLWTFTTSADRFFMFLNFPITK